MCTQAQAGAGTEACGGPAASCGCWIGLESDGRENLIWADGSPLDVSFFQRHTVSQGTPVCVWEWGGGGGAGRSNNTDIEEIFSIRIGSTGQTRRRMKGTESVQNLTTVAARKTRWSYGCAAMDMLACTVRTSYTPASTGWCACRAFYPAAFRAMERHERRPPAFRLRERRGPGSNRQGVQGAHLNPLGLFLRTFLRTPIRLYGIF
jgi:hypothetical protein